MFWSDLQSTSRLKKWTQLLENCVVIILNLISLRPLILVHPFVFLDDVTARHSAGSWTLYREHHLRGQHLLSFFLSLEAELKSVIFYNLNILLFVFFYTLFCSINILYIVYHLFNFSFTFDFSWSFFFFKFLIIVFVYRWVRWFVNWQLILRILMSGYFRVGKGVGAKREYILGERDIQAESSPPINCPVTEDRGRLSNT